MAHFEDHPPGEWECGRCAIGEGDVMGGMGMVGGWGNIHWPIVGFEGRITVIPPRIFMDFLYSP